MTATPLETIRALEAAATPAPWQTRFIYRSLRSARKDESLLVDTPESQDWPDADLIATLRTLAPELLALWAAAGKDRRLIRAALYALNTRAQEVVHG